MSVGIEVISRPLCKWNVYDIADFLYENGKNMNSNNWQRIADDMAMVAGDVRRLLDEALEEKVGDIEDLTAERDRLEGKIDDRDDDIASLEGEAADLRGELIEKDSEIEALEEKVQELEDDLSEKRSEIELLNKDISDLESRIDDLEDLVNGME